MAQPALPLTRKPATVGITRLTDAVATFHSSAGARSLHFPHADMEKHKKRQAEVEGRANITGMEER